MVVAQKQRNVHLLQKEMPVSDLHHRYFGKLYGIVTDLSGETIYFGLVGFDSPNGHRKTIAFRMVDMHVQRGGALTVDSLVEVAEVSPGIEIDDVVECRTPTGSVGLQTQRFFNELL